MKFVVFIVIFFLVGSSLAYTLTNYGHPDYPLSEPAFAQVIQMKEVEDFHQKYNNVKMHYLEYGMYDELYDIESKDKFRIVFDAYENDKIIDRLEVFYFAWIPYVG